jgi:hypothetical protein
LALDRRRPPHRSTLPDVGKQFLQRRLLHRAAGKAAIIIAVTAQFLSLMRLAFDVGLRGLALRIERVEILLKPLVTRDPGVDRAAQGGPGHEGSGKVSSNSESFASKTTGRQKSGMLFSSHEPRNVPERFVALIKFAPEPARSRLGCEHISFRTHSTLKQLKLPL